MKVKDIREMNDAELVAKLSGLKEELFNLRFQLAIGQQENSSQVKEVKKSIARVKTIQHERALKQA